MMEMIYMSFIQSTPIYDIVPNYVQINIAFIQSSVIQNVVFFYCVKGCPIG